MTIGPFRQTGIYVVVCGLTVMAALAPPAHGQQPGGNVTLQATLQGYVRDSSGMPIANATVFLQFNSGTEPLAMRPQVTHTDSEGAFRFAALRAGLYTLRAEGNGFASAIVSPVGLAQKETKKIDLTVLPARGSELQMAPPATAAPEKQDAQTPQFFDEPQFTVAGVTQATNAGGHGSDTVLRTTEALAKATVSLSKAAAGSSSAATSAVSESSLRDAVRRRPDNFEANGQLGKLLAGDGRLAQALPFLQQASRLNPADPEAHRLLGDVEEKLGNPLEAVRDYARAAELDPNEPNLFDWGTELLTHRALEPATEVFTKGNRLFPKSVRMLVALGVSWYARGSYDQAAQCLVNASDLAPDNPTPYVFLGKMQSVEGAPPAESVERLRRFLELQPGNALANYYYAVSLWKQPTGAVDAGNDTERSARVESLLQKAVYLDPKFGAAYLQLGILYSERADFSRAISAYRQAIKVTPTDASREMEETLEVTHYRLAQVYRQTGDKIAAQQELQLHAQLAKKTKEDAERERKEIQQFAISLRNTNSVSPPRN